MLKIYIEIIDNVFHLVCKLRYFYLISFVNSFLVFFYAYSIFYSFSNLIDFFDIFKHSFK